MESNPNKTQQCVLLFGDVLRITAQKPVLITISFEDILTGDLDYFISDEPLIETHGTESK